MKQRVDARINGEQVEAEVVGPDSLDVLTDWLEHKYKSGEITKVQIRSALQKAASLRADSDTGRALASALGGFLGSSNRWLGAAIGAGVAALAYDLLREFQVQQQEEAEDSHRYKLLRGPQ